MKNQEEHLLIGDDINGLCVACFHLRWEHQIQVMCWASPHGKPARFTMPGL